MNRHIEKIRKRHRYTLNSENVLKTLKIILEPMKQYDGD